MSLNPALPEPTKAVSLCTKCLYERGTISSCGGEAWQEGPKKSFSIVLGELEPEALNFRSSLHPRDGALPNPTASLLFPWPRWAPPSQLPSLWSSCKGAPFSLKRQPEECDPRVRSRKWGFQSCSSPGNYIPLCLYCLIFFF